MKPTHTQDQLSPGAKALVSLCTAIATVAQALPDQESPLEKIGFAVAQLLQFGANQMSQLDPPAHATPGTIRVHRAFCEANAAFQRIMTSEIQLAPANALDKLKRQS